MKKFPIILLFLAVSVLSPLPAWAQGAEFPGVHKAMPPEIIQSRIVGPFTGFTGSTAFTLENGQRWRQSQPDSRYFPKVESPPVIIVKGQIGYRMYIAGGGDIRVSRVR